MTPFDSLSRAQAVRQIGVGIATTLGLGHRVRSHDGSPARFADPAAVSGTATTNAAAARGVYDSFVNVRSFGAAGDGSTDDTDAIQRALDTASNTDPKTIYLPRGVYRLTRELVVPFAPGVRIIGDGSEGPSTQLLQTVAGRSILRFSRSLTHTAYMADLELAYRTPQTDRGSMAIVYRDETDPSPSWFHHVYERLKIINAYRGFSLDDDPSTDATIWHTVWRDINFFQIKHSCIRLVMGRPNGQPALWFQNIGVFNTNGARVKSTGPAIEIGPAEVMIDQYDIEGWSSQILSMTAGTFATVRGVHVEQHIFREASAYLFNLDNMTFSLDGFSIEGSNASSNTQQLVLFLVKSAAAADISNGTINVKVRRASPALRQVLWHTGGAQSVTVKHLLRAGGDLALPSTSSGSGKALSSALFPGASPESDAVDTSAGDVVHVYSADGTRYRLTVSNAGLLRAQRG